jgi:lipopolysaccharide export system permease protein
MRILRNYILSECVLPFFLALGVLTCVFLLGNLIQLVNLVINKGVSLAVIGKVFLLSVPLLLGYTLPLACLVGITLAFSRLSADNEIIAIRASGIYLLKLLMPLLAVGIVFSFFLFILTDRIIPYAYHEQRVMLKTLGSRNPTALLEPGVFITSFEKQILFIHRIDDNKFFNITIYQPQANGKPTRTITAKRGEFSPVPGKDQIILKLIDGTSDEPDLQNPNNFYKLNFQTFFMTLDLSAENKKEITKKPKGMSLSQIVKERQRLEKLLVKTSAFETEYWRKITWAFSPLIFILLAFPVSIITNKRDKRAKNVFIVILLAVTYYLFSLGCEALSLQEVAPAGIILWVPNLIGFIAAVIFNFRLLRM